MQKRITNIHLNNYRAYFGQYPALELAGGESMLIYGENGSGKSSLYKAINNYFASSNRPTLPFVKNHYQTGDDGNVSIEFSDFEPTTHTIVPGTNVIYTFGSAGSTNGVPFIQTSALVGGFLDYTDLLKVYLHNEPVPNLFELIVTTLLGDHVPVYTGGNFKFATKWHQLQRDLIETFNRNTIDHRNGIVALPIFEVHLRGTLDAVFVELNRLLSVYFNDLRIQLSYTLQPINFNYGPKWSWFTTADLRLQVIKDGVAIVGGYSDLLNEARLSAIAICLYLASLRCNPSAVELKFLFLDDVFIGLDAGNRLPILKILQTEFSDYQKFISTYDRHWYELAKKFFTTTSDLNWQSFEIYVGTHNVGGTIITKPIIVKGEGHAENAVRYLHNNSRPDYPASANYFRKALEELVLIHIPKFELADSDFTQLADYKLGPILTRVKKFLTKTGNQTGAIDTIIGFLSVLLHPLSHHEISAPIYKEELILLEKAYYAFKHQLINLDANSKYQCVLESKSKLRLTLVVNAAINHFLYYDISLEDNLLLEIPAANPPRLFPCNCYATRLHGTNNGVALPSYSPPKINTNFIYTSLDDALDRIFSHVVTTETALVKPVDYRTVYEYHDGINWLPLPPKLI